MHDEKDLFSAASTEHGADFDFEDADDDCHGKTHLLGALTKPLAGNLVLRGKLIREIHVAEPCDHRCWETLCRDHIHKNVPCITNFEHAYLPLSATWVVPTATARGVALMDEEGIRASIDGDEAVLHYYHVAMAISAIRPRCRLHRMSQAKPLFSHLDPPFASREREKERERDRRSRERERERKRET